MPTLNQFCLRSSLSVLAAIILVAGLWPATAAEAQPRPACPPDEVPEIDFSDTNGNTHRASIDCLVRWGVTRGAAPGVYGAADSVNRGQMAAFVARLLEQAGTGLPTAGTAAFRDVEGYTHADAIAALADLGIVEGRGNGEYAPYEDVSRAQMTTFLVRAFEQVSDDELPAGEVTFEDVAGHAHEESIAKAATVGFTAGRTADRFVPDAPVRRDQMATFIVNALDEVVARDLATLPSPPEPLPEPPPPPPEPEPEPAAAPTPAEIAVEEAHRQLGKPYRWGGNGPDAFDCSGLTRWVWRAAGVTLPRVSRDQYSATRRVSLENLRPGDLVFFHSPISHVGIYIGDGKMIEAANSRNPVRIASIYGRGYVGAGRPR